MNTSPGATKVRRSEPGIDPGDGPAGRVLGDGRERKRRNLTEDVALLTLGSLFTQGTQILSVSMLARLVAKDQLATYQQLNLLYGIIAPLMLAGVPAALLYFIPRASAGDSPPRWVSRAFLVLVALGLASAGIAIAFRAELAALMNNADLANAIVVFAPYLLFMFVVSATPAVLVASGRPRGAALLNACTGACLLIALATAAVVHPTGEALALALTCASAALALVSIVIVASTVGIEWADARRGRGMLELFTYGGPLALTGLAGMMGYQFDRVVVGSSFQPRQFAVYALGAIEVPAGILLAAAVSNVLVPELATRWRAGDAAGVVALWRRAMRKSSLILFPLFAFLVVMAGDAVRVLYGDGYGGSVGIFRIYLLLLPLRIATWGLIPQAVGRTGVNLSAAVIILAVNITLAVGLVGPLGLDGPAIAAPASAAIAAAYYLVRIRGIAGIRSRELVPLRSLARTMLVALAAAVPLVLIRRSGLGAPLQLASGGGLFGAVALVALRATGCIGDADWTRLMDAFRRSRRWGLIRLRPSSPDGRPAARAVD